MGIDAILRIIKKNLMMKQTEKDILEYIEKSNGDFFGGIARRFRIPNKIILECLMDLKSRGLIYKDKDGGRFKMQRQGQ